MQERRPSVVHGDPMQLTKATATWSFPSIQAGRQGAKVGMLPEEPFYFCSNHIILSYDKEGTEQTA